MIQKMAKRGFSAVYAPTAEEAKKKVLELVPPTGVVALLGSQTLNQIGVYSELRAGGRELVDHNPCARSGYCHDCQLESSICCYFAVIDRSRPAGRVKVVLIGEDLGY